MLPSHTCRPCHPPVTSLLTTEPTGLAERTPWAEAHTGDTHSPHVVAQGHRKAVAPDSPPRTQGQAALAPLPHAAQESHQTELREMEEGRRDHSKGAEKKKLSVKPELGPSSRWHSSSEESSERKTA